MSKQRKIIQRIIQITSKCLAILMIDGIFIGMFALWLLRY